MQSDLYMTLMFIRSESLVYECPPVFYSKKNCVNLRFEIL